VEHSEGELSFKGEIAEVVITTGGSEGNISSMKYS